ncbi:MAG: hypothetical protein KDM81_21780, partial [Verrucomicrobiae bacterium]|nr:hypothetical protein [Verrucomicrobiae bacterium]
MRQWYGRSAGQEGAPATPAPAPAIPPPSNELFAGYAMIPPPTAAPTAPVAEGRRSAGRSTTWNIAVPGEVDQAVATEGESLRAGLEEANKAFAKGAVVDFEPASEAFGGRDRGRTRGLAVAADSETAMSLDSLARPEIQLTERYSQNFDSGLAAVHVTVVTNGPVPVLGDVPMMGRLFRSESAVPVEPAPTAESGGVMESREELAALPLELPTPAFMGSPMDLTVASTSAEDPQSATMRNRTADAKRRGGAVAEAEVERLQRAKGKSED